MASLLYSQYLMSIFICVLLVYFISLINTVVNLMGFTLMVLIISWKVNNAIKGYLIGKRVISSNGKAVLITGCDSGFGNALALKLNELGFYVIATCLNVECTGAQHLTNKSLFPHRICVIKLDVTQDLQVIQTYDEVSQILRTNNLKLWSLVNNAGIFAIGFIEWGNGIKAYQNTIDVNVFGCVRMTRQFLPLIRESRGRVINMSSVASRMSPEGYSSYVMSKHALQAFTDTLRKEMFRFGVKVIGIEPSCYRTPMTTIETVSSLQDKYWNETTLNIRERYGENFFNTFKASFSKQTRRARDPKEVIDAMVDAVINEEPNIRYKCCGLLAGIIWSMAELLPSEIFDDIWRLISNIEIFSK